ncbi:hypothetical protein PLICRDRAFT_697601 [Plicaturopsis crispa FD-325 SS-3]|nr:hypothetical protein PLICRDRAFT_697601 [Plicaturopsis crispa FD-325 SS-3]
MPLPTTRQERDDIMSYTAEEVHVPRRQLRDAADGPPSAPTIAFDARPVTSLPNEVLALIFEAGHFLDPPVAYKKKNFRQLQKPGPFRATVASVSRRWRAIATRLPSIWRSIHIDLACPSDAPIVAEVLRRSEPSGIFLTLSSEPSSDSRSEDAVLLDLVLMHIERWEEFVVETGSIPMLVELCARLGPAFAPLLRRIVVNAHNVGPASAWQGYTPIFEGGTPSLRHLSYHGIALHMAPPCCHSVTTLNLESIHRDEFRISFHDLREFLNGFTSLERLRLKGDFVYGWSIDGWPASQDKPTLPRLRYMAVQAEDKAAHSIANILAFIRAPILETVVLDSLEGFSGGFFQRIAGGSNLLAVRTMKLTFCRWGNANSRQIMKAFPQLSHLHLNGRWEDCYRALLYDETGPPLCAHLCQITLPIYGLTTAQSGALCEAMKVRTQQGVRVPLIRIPAFAAQSWHATSLEQLRVAAPVEIIALSGNVGADGS